MPCSVCGSKTKKPMSRQHLTTAKHKRHEREQIKRQNKRFLFKLVIAGGDAVGKTTLSNILMDNKFQSMCTLGRNFRFDTRKIKFEDYDVTIQIWDATSKIENKQFYKHLRKTFFAWNSFTILIFDITRYKTFNQALYQLMVSFALSGRQHQFILIGNKADLSSSHFEDIADEDFGINYSLAMTYLYNFYIDYLQVSMKEYEVIDLKSYEILQLASHYNILQSQISKDSSVKTDELCEKSANPFLYGWYITQLIDRRKLESICMNDEINIRHKLLAIKRLYSLDGVISVKFPIDHILHKVTQLYQLSSDELYITALSDDLILLRVVALTLIKDEKILQEFVAHKNPMFRLYALSNLKDEKYFNFITDIYHDEESDKEVLIHNIEHSEFLLKLIMEENNMDVSKKIIQKISTLKELHVLRLISPVELQPTIISRIEQISQS
ncbi:MAG: ADP-ribosylation factor-like protein [Candidatus Heimdallarchaeota archaeon]|nr:ADP-ribosylation factor-like protein [Candidatus Heimdallarchaeota archaeon]MDH5646457.1 ADP-ribosylation factor-like protein [Candidatus Heimdallarchaeota archaeon]